MKNYLAITLLLSPMAQASWLEFCHFSGHVVSDIGSHELGKKFQLKVEKAEEFSIMKGEINFSSYTNCQKHVGKVYEVFYSDKEYIDAGQPKKGESHCSSYTFEDWGSGASVHWVSGCGNG